MKEKYDVYIGGPVPRKGIKGSKWENPKRSPRDGSREEVIKWYEEWIQAQPELMAALHELKGRVLGCWCSPLPCHGDVLARLANDD